MTITAVALDLDGTLLPRGTHRLSARTVAALRAVQSSGIRVIVATGRAVCAVPPALLGGFVPDAAVYSGGALVLDGEGRTLATRCLDDQPMYALVDWCEDYDYPIAFAYPEAYYAYVGYDRMTGFYPAGMLRDGEDQDRHLEGKPFAAQCCMPPEGAAGFTERYGHLGLRLVPFAPGRYDVCPPDTDKAVGVRAALAALGLSPEGLAAAGDAENDRPLLALAALPVTVESAPESLRAAARLTVPDPEQEGVAAFLKQLAACRGGWNL